MMAPLVSTTVSSPATEQLVTTSGGFVKLCYLTSLGKITFGVVVFLYLFGYFELELDSFLADQDIFLYQ